MILLPYLRPTQIRCRSIASRVYITKQTDHSSAPMSADRLALADRLTAESSEGVAVAVNNPVNVGLDVGVELVPELEAVSVAPGQSLDAAYHAPLMMTP
jgi:hypothetical protein